MGEFGFITRIIRKYLPFLLNLLKGGDNNAPESRNWIGATLFLQLPLL